MARPNHYHSHIEPKLKEIATLRSQGLSLPSIAEKIGVSSPQLTHYKKTYPDLEAALRTSLAKPLITKRSAHFNRQKNYHSLRSFIRTQSTKEEREEYFRLILEKADETEIQIFLQMIEAKKAD